MMAKFTLKFIPVSVLPVLALTIANIIWGGSFIVAKFTLDEIPIMTLAFLRFFLATFLLFPFILSAKNQTKIDKKDLLVLISIGLLMVTFNIAFFFEGLALTTVTQASILTLAIPFVAILVGWWFLKEKVYPINLVGILLGLIGASILIVLPIWESGTEFSQKTLLGNIFILISDVAWVVGAALTKKIMTKYSTLTLTTIMFIVGAVSFLLPAVNEYIQNPRWTDNVTAVGVLGIVYMAAASSVSAYFLFEWGLKQLGIIRADYFQYIEPFVAIILAILLLGEQLQPILVVCGILIGLGGYWGTRFQEHPKRHKAHRI